MVTFFGILLTLIISNVVLLLFSVNRSTQRTKPNATNVTQSVEEKVHPLDIVLSNYKKVV